MYRLAALHHYEHVNDFLSQYDNGTELDGWLEYLRLHDEIQTNRLIYAIRRAFNGDKAETQTPDDDDEPVIDTTDPGFAESFQGFTGAPGIQRPQQRQIMRNTEIKFG